MTGITPMRRTPGLHVSGTRADVLAWLRSGREFGLAAEITADRAAAHPGMTAYTPDGCCWVTVTGGTWQAGDSADAEMRLADRRHPAVVRTRIDPDAVAAGDTVTWATPQAEVTRERSGTVEYATAGHCHVITGSGYRYPVGWLRLTGHTPKAGTR